MQIMVSEPKEVKAVEGAVVKGLKGVV